MKLAEAIHSVSAKLFPTVDGVRRPDYGGIFVEAVSAVLAARKVKFDRSTLEKVAEHINLSSFQRGAAMEAVRRYGTVDAKTGERTGPKPKVERAKRTGTVAIDGRKPRLDPITGEPIVRKPKAPKAKTEKVKAVLKPKKSKAPKVAKKPKAPKAVKEAPSKPAKPKLDPITGEPIQAEATV